MQITVHVDQARALREGIDAPHSTCRIEVNPADLTQPERDVLATLLQNGHDARGQIAHPQAPDEAPKTGYGRKLTVASPDYDGLRRGLSELLAWHADERAELVAKRVKADADIDAAIAERQLQPQLVTLGAGKIVDAYMRDDTRVVEISIPVEPRASTGYASPEAIERLAIARAEAREEAARIREAARPELERLVAAAAERKAALEAEYQALYMRLPEPLRQRHAGGHATASEVNDALLRLALADAGVEPDPWIFDDDGSEEPLGRLSDAEFAALQAARKAAPEGATVEPARIWHTEWRGATEQELADGLGDEDDEIEERIDERRVLLVKWTIGGRLEVTAVAPLS